MGPMVRLPEDTDSSRRHWADSPTKVLGLIAAILSVLTGAFALLAQLGAFGDFRIPFLPGKAAPAVITGETTISLSKGQGPSGSTLVVSGSGYSAGEQISILFHTETIALARADSAGTFEATAKVPGTFDAFGTQQLTITAVGNSSARHARAPFQLEVSGGGGPNSAPARITLSTTTGKSGTKVTVTGENFAAGEEVRIRFHTEEIGAPVADAKGSFVQVVTIPTSFDRFAPQQFDIVATGQKSIETDHRPFKLTK